MWDMDRAKALCLSREDVGVPGVGRGTVVSYDSEGLTLRNTNLNEQWASYARINKAAAR